ncbi:D-Ala-D-Ala carboxypeptidase family metallohydrolase [Sneathiella marina]|uniref:D-Ala-D-Ala carboxypeptidase family metallohydrolase n=1 Tax=Sneathiella marina TaxID=2950108 RepID=A0ABY4VZX6_9PROT|nr:D-Ala-D-Ala carboxypeptidase family metallohydrolase [Sneathiella marina]USG60435.1 D-Ala-D-Ala carboxypeptidase family metallohydrolase [Sneathiella marina]
MQLTTNFTLQELIKSQTALRLDIRNIPSEEEVANLRLVAEHILQPVRDHFKIPFVPTSGYRCRALNRALKSKDTSQHIKGQAVDLEIPTISNLDLASWIRDTLKFDQLILEFYTAGDKASGWVHCSYVEKNRRMAVINIADDKEKQSAFA